MRIAHICLNKRHSCIKDLMFHQAYEHEVFFIILLPKHDPQYRIQKTTYRNGVRHIYIDTASTPQPLTSDTRLSRCLGNILSKIKPDIAHVQIFSGMTPLAILSATRKLRIRTILTTHDHSLWCANGHCFDQERTCTATSLLKCSCASTQGLAAYRHQTLSACNRQRKTAFNKTISMADHIICCSHWQKNAIDRLSRKPSRTTALHFGTDLLPQEKFPVKRVTRKKPCFGYLGSLSHLKGTDLLIDAIDRLDPDKFTLLASALLNNKHSSEFKGYFRSLIKHPSVRIITLDRKDDLYPQFFSKIDYLIIPSIWEETGPLTLFESLFYRTPVIIARKESLLEKVTLNVNALAFSDSNDLASVLNKIIAGKITLRKTRALPRKTMKEYADEIYGIYKEQ